MATATKGKKVIRKRRERKNVEKGQVHIRSSFNNTMVTVTGLGALTADGQALAVPHAAVAADLGQALDVHRHVTAEVALHSVAVADDLAQLGLIFLGQILHAGVGVDSGLGQDLVGAGAPNAVDISEADLDSLLSRQVNTGNTSHLLQHLQFNLVSAYAWGFRKLP